MDRSPLPFPFYVLCSPPALHARCVAISWSPLSLVLSYSARIMLPLLCHPPHVSYSLSLSSYDDAVALLFFFSSSWLLQLLIAISLSLAMIFFFTLPCSCHSCCFASFHISIFNLTSFFLPMFLCSFFFTCFTT
jgi:hypothetical protein